MELANIQEYDDRYGKKLVFHSERYTFLTGLHGAGADIQTIKTLLLIGSLIALIIFFQIIRYYQQHQQSDKIYQSYLKFINKLNHAGLLVKISEDPETIKSKAIKRFPEQ